MHRYVGLAMAAFLLVAGITGSLIAFYVPIDTLINPELFNAAPPTAGAPMLDPFTLQERFIAQLPEAQRAPLSRGVILHQPPGKAVNFWVDRSEVFVNPYTAAVQGSRKFGELSGKQGLMTFLYELHFSLALGDVGTALFGLVALLWTVDCFVGAYLTFPPPAQRKVGGAARKSWLARWLPAWLLKTNKLFTAVFTWHRASGLWVWLMLLIFAWSAVALNLGEYVYSPVMNSVFGAPKEHDEGLPHHDPPKTMSLPLREAHALGQRLMRAESAKRGFEVLGERGIEYDGEHDAYAYTIESSLDVSERLAETMLMFDAQGRVLAFHAPTGQHAGSTVTSWLIALHFGAVREGGLAYRTFVCVLGLVVALLSVTGVWIWLKKRPARDSRKKLRPAKHVRPRRVREDEDEREHEPAPAAE
ncbi:MAG: PepSY-associated TM helix domain-containing protein [Polyangiales bacterium]